MSRHITRRKVFIAAFAICVLPSAHAQALSKRGAIALAEQFIARNGYTSLPRDQVKPDLNPESLEWGDTREKQLEYRFNTLSPKAIGIKSGARGTHNGWSVAFDYVGGGPSSETCRVVTMTEDGRNLVVQHVDGIRKYFAGFD